MSRKEIVYTYLQEHGILFLNAYLQEALSWSFHPNDCTGTVVISNAMFAKYLQAVGNTYEYMEVY